MFKIQSHVYAFRCNIICHLHHDKQYTMYNISQALCNIVQHYCHKMWASRLVEVLQIIVFPPYVCTYYTTSNLLYTSGKVMAEINAGIFTKLCHENIP